MRAIFFVSLAGVVATAAGAHGSTALDQARNALMSGSYPASIQLATDGISSPSVTPVDKAKLQVIRGEAVFDLNPLNASLEVADMTAAKDELSQVIDKSKPPQQICASYSNVFVYRGLANVRLRHYADASEDMQNAVHCDPNDAFVQFGLGESFYGTEDFEKAVAAYSAAIKLRPDYKDAYAHRAQNYENLHDLDKALADYNEVLRLAPNDSSSYNNRGTALSMMGRTDEALADVSKAIDLEPQSFMAYLNRSGLYYKKGDFNNALADWSAGKAILEKQRPDLEKTMGPKTVAWFDYGFADMKERLDDAPK